MLRLRKQPSNGRLVIDCLADSHFDVFKMDVSRVYFFTADQNMLDQYGSIRKLVVYGGNRSVAYAIHLLIVLSLNIQPGMHMPRSSVGSIAIEEPVFH